MLDHHSHTMSVAESLTPAQLADAYIQSLHTIYEYIYRHDAFVSCFTLYKSESIANHSRESCFPNLPLLSAIDSPLP